MFPIALAQTADDVATTAAGTGIFAAMFGFWAIFGVISLVFFIWWIVLLIDLTKREFPEKTTWLILMVVGLLIGFVWLIDIIYYFAIVKKGTGKSGGTSAPAQPTQ
jgi:glucan phosphoethanolaminetransferase (alkaline phosphatase superfamily)